MEVRILPGAYYSTMAAQKHLKGSAPSKTNHTAPLRRLRVGLQEELGLFNNMVNHIGDELMLINHEGRIVFVNEATVRGLGYPKKRILNRRITDFFQERMSVRDWQRKHFAELKRRRRPISYQVERKAAGGKVQTIGVTAVYMLYQSEGYVLSIARDITKQIATQNSLKQSKDLYRLLSDGAGDGILTVDLSGRITYANRALEQLVKIPIRQSHGRNFLEYIDKKSLPKAQLCFRKAKQGMEQIREEIEVLARGGQAIPVEISVSPLYRKDKIVSIHAIIRDVRRRKQLEQLIVESEKMKAIQYFISGTAEELKNPLLAVWNRTQGLLKKYKDRQFEYIGFKEFADLMRSLENVTNQIKHCYATTERMIALNKKRIRIQQKRCRANAIVREIVRLRDNEFKINDIRCRVRLAEGAPPVAIGEIEFRQVIANIINNAVQAMPAGGMLTIRSSILKYGRGVLFTISDNGVGIESENLPHIFEPFFTTRQRGVEKNSGLGLYIAYALLKACRGNIRVESSLRKGTTVRVVLPVAKTAGRG